MRAGALGLGVGRTRGRVRGTLPLPAGFKWPSQIDPVSYDRSIPMVWGDRPAASKPSIYDKNEWRPTLPRNAWNFSSRDNNEVIFEVRSGDRYGFPVPEGGWTDPDTSERAEMQSVNEVPVDWTYTLSWQSLFEGSANTSPWCVIMQCFATGPGGSPPIALTMETNDTLRFVTRTDASGSVVETYRHNYPFARDQWIDFHVECFFSRADTGFARLYINGATAIEAENISIGYLGQTAWQPTLGIYRSEAPETLRHHVRNVVVSF